jgi:hypothetical protein
MAVLDRYLVIQNTEKTRQRQSVSRGRSPRPLAWQSRVMIIILPTKRRRDCCTTWSRPSRGKSRSRPMSSPTITTGRTIRPWFSWERRKRPISPTDASMNRESAWISLAKKTERKEMSGGASVERYVHAPRSATYRIFRTTITGSKLAFNSFDDSASTCGGCIDSAK